MQLLGDRNWYLPRWLEWLPNVHVEGARVAPLPPALVVRQYTGDGLIAVSRHRPHRTAPS